MSRSRTGDAVLSRLDQIESLFQDMLSSLTEASVASSSEYRAALIVGARALNLFLVNFRLAEHVNNTLLVRLNSRMLRLSEQSGPDLTAVHTIQREIIESILHDVAERRHTFAPADMPHVKLSPSSLDDGYTDDPAEDSTEDDATDSSIDIYT